MDPFDFWNILPDPALLYVFSYLNAKELLNVRNTCRNWMRVATDELLWKRLFQKDFKIDKNIPIAPGKYSWFDEYRRLKYHTPIQQSEILTEHKNEVLHVSFSHNGEMFASSSKDGYIKVWKASYPAEVRYSTDMKSFSWNYTQFSQFNESDTLLLVSGVHFGVHTASGEIAIFNLQRNFKLQCRVLNKPYDIFGTWYAEDYLLSGRLHFLDHLLSCSSLWINKVWQEPESEKKPIIKRLFRFYNRRGGSVRTITVANCLITDQEMNALEYGPSTSTSQPVVHGNPISRDALSISGWPLFKKRTLALKNRSFFQDTKIHFGAETKEACTMNSPIRYTQEYRQAESAEIQCEPSVELENTSSDGKDSLLPWDEEWSGFSDDENSQSILYEHSWKENFHNTYPHTSSKSSPNEEEDSEETANSIEEDTSFDRILDPRDKFLIFATGSLTYTPHQIGFKRIKPFKFAESRTETPPSTPSKQMEGTEEVVPSAPNLQDVQKVFDVFDPIDCIIDLHGHIIGMGLSPDHRYLYVNSRPWPQGYVIENPLTPPPIAQEIDIHVIDMMTLKEVGTMLRSHRAYTPNNECFFIFLDVSDQYVASGAEDKHGYLWDRHYGNCLSKLPHNDVVNCVAFNPKDPEMMVTASDDFTLKVWRSKNRIKELS